MQALINLIHLQQPLEKFNPGNIEDFLILLMLCTNYTHLQSILGIGPPIKVPVQAQ